MFNKQLNIFNADVDEELRLSKHLNTLLKVKFVCKKI